MIGSQLRWLYYTLRGQFDRAEPHRKRVEEHAAEVGSAWQVETWQGPLLVVVNSATRDIIQSTRVAEELEVAARTVPSLKPYVRGARECLLLIRGEADRALIEATYSDPKFLMSRQRAGWARFRANAAVAHNLRGEHDQAKRICEESLEGLPTADRDYAMLFMPLELELATADAALGHLDEASARLEALLTRFESCDNPLVLGCIHATATRIAYVAKHSEAFERSFADTERWFVPTGAPALIAQCTELRAMRAELLPAAAPAAPSGEEKFATVTAGMVGEDSETVIYPTDDTAESGFRPVATSVAPPARDDSD
jgi:hypothetical protein